MDLNTLGYNQKWLDYGLLTEEWLSFQMNIWDKKEYTSTEHYRYATFLKFIDDKEVISDIEINHLTELALEDEDAHMGGAAVRHLFLSNIITEVQYERIKLALIQFDGDWKITLINRMDLIKEMKSSGTNSTLFQKSVEHFNRFKDLNPLRIFVEYTTNAQLILDHIEQFPTRRIKEAAEFKYDDLVK